MTKFNATIRAASSIALSCCLAVFAIGCDGGSPDAVSTQTAAITGQLSQLQQAVTYDVVVRIDEPFDTSAIDGVDGAPSDEVGLSIQIIPFFVDVATAVNVMDAYNASLRGVVNDEYIAEREAREATDVPVYSVLPIAACGGVFPCDLGVQVTIERHDFSVDAPIELDVAAWTDSAHAVEVLEVTKAINPDF